MSFDGDFHVEGGAGAIPLEAHRVVIPPTQRLQQGVGRPHDERVLPILTDREYAEIMGSVDADEREPPIRMRRHPVPEPASQEIRQNLPRLIASTS